MNRQIWICRAGEEGIYEDVFLKKGIIGIPDFLGRSCPLGDDLKELKKQLLVQTGETKPRLISNINAILNRMDAGDYVLVPSRTMPRTYLFGKMGDVFYDADSEAIHLYRKVDWYSRIDKDEFDRSTQYSMGSLITVFRVNATSRTVKMLEELEASASIDDSHRTL